MKIIFLGTRGYIDTSTRRHKRHTATLLIYKRKRILIDCGLDWIDKIAPLNPHAIVVTHAHPDHAWGLQHGAPCPVYASADSWKLMNNYPIAPEQRHIMHPYKRTTICGLIFQTFPVVHSIRCPGVGYRISFGKKNIFCVHDLISLDDRATALAECCLYIGDGASITRPLVRRKGTQLFGHTTIRAQLGWCQKEGIPRAIFTHCGSQIVQSDGRTINAQVQRLGRERDVQAKIAYDGMEIEV